MKTSPTNNLLDDRPYRPSFIVLGIDVYEAMCKELEELREWKESAIKSSSWNVKHEGKPTEYWINTMQGPSNCGERIGEIVRNNGQEVYGSEEECRNSSKPYTYTDHTAHGQSTTQDPDESASYNWQPKMGEGAWIWDLADHGIYYTMTPIPDHLAFRLKPFKTKAEAEAYGKFYEENDWKGRGKPSSDELLRAAERKWKTKEVPIDWTPEPSTPFFVWNKNTGTPDYQNTFGGQIQRNKQKGVRMFPTKDSCWMYGMSLEAKGSPAGWNNYMIEPKDATEYNAPICLTKDNPTYTPKNEIESAILNHMAKRWETKPTDDYNTLMAYLGMGKTLKADDGAMVERATFRSVGVAYWPTGNGFSASPSSGYIEWPEVVEKVLKRHKNWKRI